MSKANKIVIIIMSVLCAALILLAACFLLFRTRTMAGQSAPDAAAAEPAIGELSAQDAGQGVGQVVVSELMEKNRAVLRDEDGDFSDWIELHNISDRAVELEGWSLSDKAEGKSWSFPQRTLGPGEYLLVFASGKDRSGDEPHTGFSLSGDEGAYLRNAAGTLVDKALCGGCGADTAMARQDDGSFIATIYPTPGYANDSEGFELFQNTLSAQGPLVIYEAVVSNFSETWLEDMAGRDWVELKNVSDRTVELSDYYLSDDDDDYRLFRLPRLSLEPGKHVIVVCDGDDTLSSDNVLFSNFSLDSENEQLYLTDLQGALIDYAALRGIPYMGSYGRMDDRSGWFYFASPSPFGTNSDGARQISEKPTALTADGVFEGVDSVTAELTGDGVIRYTLDGSAPNARSPLYTAPIELTETTVLRAVNFAADRLPSSPLTLSYIINEGHTLPVVSLATDEPAEFKTMYEDKMKGVELPGSLSYYGEDGSFTIGCGVSMNGATSLEMAKKNMSVRFRGAYGDAKLKYDIYGGGVTEFTNLLLRSGQDFTGAIVRNELCQELCGMATDRVVNQRSIYTILYINGVYSGIYTLKEKANEQLYASLAGVSRDSVTMLEAPVSMDSDFYRDIVDFCVCNDMSSPENYERLCGVLDMDSLIDFLIIEGYCANADLTSGNVRYCRSTENDGKWRLVFYDLDATFADPINIYYNLMTNPGAFYRQISTFVAPLTENRQFRDSFLTRAGQLFDTALNEETVLSTMDSLAATIEPEVARDYARFGMTEKGWQWNMQFIRDLLEEYDWDEYNRNVLCDLFGLSEEEREHYFGEQNQ